MIEELQRTNEEKNIYYLRCDNSLIKKKIFLNFVQKRYFYSLISNAYFQTVSNYIKYSITETSEWIQSL